LFFGWLVAKQYTFLLDSVFNALITVAYNFTIVIMKMFTESKAGSEMVALCAMCVPMTYYG